MPIIRRMGVGYHHVMVTLPGCNLSPFPRKLTSIDGVAEHLKPQIPEGSVLAGHSLGGYVALSLLRLYPNSFRGVVLLHSTPFTDSAERIGKRMQTLQLIQESGVDRFYPLFADSLFFRPHPAKDLLMDMIRKTPQHAVVAYINMMMTRNDHVHTLANANIPVLIISGEFDPILPASQISALSTLLSQASIRTLSLCGHMGMYECPEQVVTELLQWLNQYILPVNQ